jgi:hypothetical protein
MIDALRMQWSGTMDSDALIGLRNGLDDMLQRIRGERRIRSPIILCRHCGKRHTAASPRVSVRALILAAKRFNVASEEDAKALERSWKEHRTEHQLDLYGRPERRPSAAGAVRCRAK